MTRHPIRVIHSVTRPGETEPDSLTAERTCGLSVVGYMSLFVALYSFKWGEDST